MRDIGVDHFKILCIKEYEGISKSRLKCKEDKYIKRFDTVKKGLNTYYAFRKICEHEIQQSRCKECIGLYICPHKKFKIQCKECGGSFICPHNKEKNKCRECGGSAFCTHNKQKKQCKICSPAVCDICSKIFAGKTNLKSHQKKVHSMPAET